MVEIGEILENALEKNQAYNNADTANTKEHSAIEIIVQ